MDFPRLVYRSASEHTVAADKEQFDGLCKEGWFASVPEALAKKPFVAEETAPTAATKPAASPTHKQKATTPPPAWQKG